MKFPHCAATVKVRYSVNLSSRSEDLSTKTLIFPIENEGILMELTAELARPMHTEDYLLVDSITDAYTERELVRDAATQLLEARRQEVLSEEAVYIPVDALSTANSVITAEAMYGFDSEERKEKWEGLLLDCQRLVGEWYRKNTSEYFEPTRHVFCSKDGEFFSKGLSIRQMTENAIVPIAEDPEEETRRVNERVEEETPRILRSLGGIALGRGIVTISECTDSAIESYQSDVETKSKHQGYRGYVPEIKKLMIRHITLDPDSEDRFQTQIGLPGTFLDHETLQIALTERGADVAHMDKTSLHGTQILADEDPMEFVKHLDAVATREWCTNIFMGEQVADDFVKDYEGYKQEALARKEALADWAETVALFVLDLAKDGFDREKAPSHVESFVKSLLLNLAKQDQSIAEQMFDAKTAKGLAEVVSLEERGLYDQANELWQKVEREAPGGGSCGAGSCGLEGVAARSKEDAALRKELGADDDDIIVKDKERSCRCGAKSIVYAYNKRKVIKKCQSCGARDVKHSKAA